MRNWTFEDIIYEDEQIIVCRKHAGMAVQSARTGQMDLESALRNYRRGGFVGIVQRLDQPVEGLLVFGKSSKATAALNAQQQNGKMKKQYLAVFVGTPSEPEGYLVDFLVKDGRTNTSRIAAQGTAGAKKAALTYRVLKTAVWEAPQPEERQQMQQALQPGERQQMQQALQPGERQQMQQALQPEERQQMQQALQSEERYPIGLAEITLETGRHHQIRVQMAAHGMPLWADGKYHPKQSMREQNQPIGLCAYRLEFEHPKTGKRMIFETEPEGEIFGKF